MSIVVTRSFGSNLGMVGGGLFSYHATALCPQHRSHSEFVVIVGDPKHDRLRVGIRYVLGDKTQLFPALSPMLGIVQKTRE